MIKSTSGKKAKKLRRERVIRRRSMYGCVQTPGPQQNMLRTVTTFYSGVERYGDTKIRLSYSDAADA